MVNVESPILKVFKEYAVLGSQDDINRFCEQAASSLPDGWSNERRYESLIQGEYVNFSRPADAKLPASTISLFIDTKKNRISVVNIVPSDKKTSCIEMQEYNLVLDDFLKFANPIALRLGLRTQASGDHAEITEWLSKDAAEALRSFSNLANKSTGSGHPHDFQRWAHFIITAHRERSKLDVSTLGRYLTEVLGWDSSHTHDLALEYEFGRALLKANDAE